VGIIEKLEELINRLIFKLLELMAKLIPLQIKSVVRKVNGWYASSILFLKTLPGIILRKIKDLIQYLKENLKAEKLKPTFFTSIKNFIKNINETHPKRSKLKNFFLLPWYLVTIHSRSLSALQMLLLITLSISSIISLFAINTSVRQLAHKYLVSRMPASIEEEAIYDRPDYYKKDLRHVEITNLRLPVFFSNVNELKTVDIDFMITTSNRFSRTFIHKHDLHLRDHLFLNLEPIVPSLPLNDEGKEIIRQKLLRETDEFLKKHKIEGHVTEVKITYILAN